MERGERTGGGGHPVLSFQGICGGLPWRSLRRLLCAELLKKGSTLLIGHGSERFAGTIFGGLPRTAHARLPLGYSLLDFVSSLALLQLSPDKGLNGNNKALTSSDVDDILYKLIHQLHYGIA